MFTFSVLREKCPFCTNLVPKFQIVCLKWNLVPKLISICKFNGDVYFFIFDQRYHFWSRNSKSSVSAEIWYLDTNSNIQNSMVMFTFSEFPFWANLVPKFKIICLEVKFGLIRICRIQWWCLLVHFFKFATYTNSNVQNLMVMCTFPVLTGNTLCRETWSKKSKLSV